jgi:hypothetical protein
MTRVKKLLATAAVLVGLLALPAHAVITVNSVIDNAESPTGIRAQAVIKEATDGGSTQVAQSIKAIDASILIRDGQIENGLLLRKKQLSATEAYGQGLPLGYQQPPFTDPEGPWFGLTWPYRDQYDYFNRPTDPLGDDVGFVFDDQPGVYGIVDIRALARGGPTDEVPPPGQNTPQWLTRGIPGNGLENPATYMQFEIVPLLGPLDREITLRIFGASAIVVQRDSQTGNYSEIRVPIPDFETTIRLPEPSVGAVLALSAITALRRGRRQR